jgi:type IV secretion system protein VirB6
MSAISGFRQSAGLRQARRDDRLADRMKGTGGEKKAPRRHHEGNSAARTPASTDTPEQQNLNRP